MATTYGLVQQLSLFALGPQLRNGCAYIGAHPSSVEIFTVYTSDADPLPEREQRISMLRALEAGLVGRVTVAVEHDAGSSVVKQVHLYGSDPL